MAEARGGKGQQSQSPKMFYTFVIEIDRQGAPEQERLRWRWPEKAEISTATPSVSSTSFEGVTTVAQKLLRFLHSHIFPDTESRIATASAGTAVGDQRHRGCLVEMHDPGVGGWILLTERTPSDNIPRNCRVHVKVDARLKTATPSRRSAHSPPPLSETRSGDAPPSSSFSGTAKEKMSSNDADSRAIPTVDGFLRGRGGLDATVQPEAAGEVLALPWRRFDQDLQAGGEEGLDICGRRLTIGHISNSSEGTGLFTWDGSVLLAKYLEHQATTMRRDFCDEQQSCGDENATFLPRNEKIGDPQDYGISDETGSDHNRKSNSRGRTARSTTAVRVLELGCGTGLAGLAAAFAFGKQRSVRSKATVCSLPRDSPPPEGEGDRVGERVSPAAEGQGAEVVLTDLEYALANARANIERNASSLEDFGVKVDAMELDWCRPLPQEFVGGGSFDLILAADVVWLDDLVDPLVRTLERLTARWPCPRTDNIRQRPSSKPPSIPSEGTQGEGSSAEELAVETASVINTAAKPHEGAAAILRPRPRVGRRVLIAYQWRSERTGTTLLQELGAAFHVREIPPEECHPRYLPSSDLCLFEAVRRDHSGG